MPHVFISYCVEDKVTAEALCAALESDGIRCWIAPRDIPVGEDREASIVNAINNSRLIVVISSSSRVQPAEVKEELERARGRGVAIVTFDADKTKSRGMLTDARTPGLSLGLLGPAATTPTTPTLQQELRRFAARIKGLVSAATPKAESRPDPQPGGHPGRGDVPSLELPYQSGRCSTRPDADAVDCTVFAPPVVAAGTSLMVQVFASRPDQAASTEAIARRFDAEAEPRGVTSLEMEVPQGTKLTFHLVLPSLNVRDDVQHLIWRGSPVSVQFAVDVPAGASAGSVVGRMTISQNTAPIGHIVFKLSVTSREQPDLAKAESTGEASAYRKVFISYSSRDRTEVVKRVHLFKTFGIKYFQDVLDLEPGDLWEQRLYSQIDKSDLFLLFWSSSARDSEWVMKEIQYAMKLKGSDDAAPPAIVPVLLEGPPPPKPPPELSHLHFNDRLLYFMAEPLRP
jgi:hypothetical protein